MPNITLNYTNSYDIVLHDSASGQMIVYNLGDISWMLSCTALVWVMIPGAGFFYSGLLRRKNALNMIYLSMTTIATVSFQWFFWGYSLTYSDSASPFIGDLKYFALRGVLEKPSIASDHIPATVHCVYQLMFAAFTPMLALGGFAERCRLGPIPLFVFVWTTLVYDPIACWIWNKVGWSRKIGAIDYAGGTPVHISSGTAALAISIYLGKRSGYGTESLKYSPHNTTYVVLGTVFLWFGWFGFNGGSALSADLRAAYACTVTNLAASVGGLTWMLWDYFLGKRWSVVAFCSGALSGLVAITPAAGYVGSPAALVFGVVAGTLCNFATQLKFVLHYDECLDVFACHGVGGIVGNLLTGLFAQAYIAGLDPPSQIVPSDEPSKIAAGWLNRHYIQLAYQIADSAAGFAYSFIMTTLILWVFHFIPFLRLRTSEEAETVGIDENDMGESAYDFNTGQERGSTELNGVPSPPGPPLVIE
ncbi:Ammonium transporter 1 [Schizosaccharomyces pombe 972h-] [Rhizoctonia solani]|uniref:Ammonium transporter n=1 Tax=Rhizoctonia solani TaxID=456999 RepID=A0A0K6FPK0_9AGAM|nr:Ammonium transporter 1 [Schizosaccharomyces pombe 972h-] [Rhizoctonia solani]